MSFRKSLLLSATLIGMGISGMYLTSCRTIQDEGMVLYSRVPAAHFECSEEGKVLHYPGTQLVVIQTDNPEQSETILTTDFYSACAPDLSYDAGSILFSAQQTENDPWQIWEMDLKKGRSRQITDFDESCYGPKYLPGNRLVFSKQGQDAWAGSSSALYTMNLDGSDLNRITFHPHFDYPATILRDGRILMRTQQLYPEKGEVKYMALRPNGTKAVLFYHGDEGCIMGTKTSEIPEGQVYFVEKGVDHKMRLVSVNQNRPLHSKRDHSSEIAGNFYSAFPVSRDELLASYRPPEKQVYGLYRFSVPGQSLSLPVIEYSDYHIVDPIPLNAYTRPRNLPDEVDKMKSSGQLLCQNIHVTALPKNDSADWINPSGIEVLGPDRSYGIVPVEEDGSFYLEVKADTPFRLQTIDDKGQILNGPSGWLWLRPFERRACVGCHEDPELVPENLVPLAVKKLPVSIPVVGNRESGLHSKAGTTE